MVKVFQGTNKEYYMDGYLKACLDASKKAIKDDWDMLIVVDGYEGSGKSTLALQMAYYCDPTLDLSRIVFNPDDFKATVMSAQPFQSVVFDEAYGGLSSRGAMGQVNKSLVQMLTTIRQKNLFIFIVLPSFFDLDKYVALWRSRALIHIYSGKPFSRGSFKFFNIDRKKELYVYGKKYYEYNKGKHNFLGSFTKYFIVDKEAYKTKKTSTSVQLDDQVKESKAHVRREAHIEIAHRLKANGKTQEEVAKVLGISRQTVSDYTVKYNPDGSHKQNP